jgi:VWFA-related protein
MRSAVSRRNFLETIINAVTMIGAGRVLSAQQQPTFTTEVKVVALLANVMTKKGAIIRDLTKDDFVLAENGRPQTIRYFSRQTDLPLTLGLLVDTSMSQEKVLDQERAASFRFLDQVLRDGKDHVFVLQFDLTVLVRAGMTSSFAKLNDALTQVQTPTREDLKNQTGGGTLLYDAIVTASEDMMSKQQGRKAVIVMTDGVDFGSQATLDGAIDAAQRADTLIYSILFSDAGYYGVFGGGGDGRRVLQRISHETGGGFFEVTRKQSIDDIFSVIQDELRSQYNLGFVSDAPVGVSEFRKLTLNTRQKGLVVQTRDRYWAEP